MLGRFFSARVEIMPACLLDLPIDCLSANVSLLAGWVVSMCVTSTSTQLDANFALLVHSRGTVHKGDS